MSDAVLADAQFSAVRVFRPFPGFETVYQGKSTGVPIAIPGSLDANAGKPGFDPNLISGISVPMGARLLVWVPSIFNGATPFGFEVQPYSYKFVWRVRNIQDFRSGRSPYHFPKQSFGTNNQFVIPSAAKVAVYENAAEKFPSTVVPFQFQNYLEARQGAFIESISFPSAIPDPPLTPSGQSGAYQQGLADSGAGSNLTVSFNALQMDVEGDELIILVNRNVESTDSESTWDFAASDLGFSSFFGTANGTRNAVQDMGIYIMTGSNP